MVTTAAPRPAERSARVRASQWRRRSELGMILLAAMVTGGAYVLVSLGQNGRIPGNTGWFLAVVLGLGLAAHLATRLLAPHADSVLLPLAILLNGLGYVMIARLDVCNPHLKYAPNQAAWTALGIVAYIGTLLVIRRSRDLDRYRYLLALVAFALLVMPLVPHVGLAYNGAKLWVRLGPLTFQPVEIAKLLLVAFFASYFIEHREMLSMGTVRIGNRLFPDPRPFGPMLLAWGFAVLSMGAENDVGFALLFFVLFITMLWLATGKIVYLLLGVVLFFVGMEVGYHLFPQVAERIHVWRDPWRYMTDPRQEGYQPIQAMIAFATGGLGGTGLGLGHPCYIPIANSDFILASFGEELGLFGTAAIVIAYLLLVGSGLRIAVAARSDFAKLAAAGYTVLFGFQAVFIMAGVVQLLPLTGVTLPFVSYGGSSLVANYALLALLMRFSNEAHVRPALRPLLAAGGTRS